MGPKEDRIYAVQDEGDEKGDGDHLSKDCHGTVKRICRREEGESFCDADGKPCSAQSADGDFREGGKESRGPI